jgi:SAM-dependent methyltransferase
MTLPPLTLNAWLRYELVERTLARLPNVSSVLEIGCGEGALAARLARRFSYVGVEPDAAACARARERVGGTGGEIVLGDVSALPAGSSFDLVCAFEVLEHLADDAGALRSWRERLEPGGRLMLTVPADPAHFGSADRRVGHVRRYEPIGLRDLLAASGYADPEVRRFGFPLGNALELGRNALARVDRGEGRQGERTAASGRWRQPPDQLGWATQAATAPFRYVQRRFDPDRGPGLFALARRG